MNSFCLAGKILESNVDTTTSGIQVAKVKLAVDKYGKDNQDSEIYEISFWGEMSQEKFSEGKILGVKGRMSSSNFEKNGKTYYAYNLIAEKMNFLS